MTLTTENDIEDFRWSMANNSSLPGIDLQQGWWLWLPRSDAWKKKSKKKLTCAPQYGYFEPAGGAGADAQSVLKQAAEGAGRAGIVVARAGVARRVASCWEEINRIKVLMRKLKVSKLR